MSYNRLQAALPCPRQPDATGETRASTCLRSLLTCCVLLGMLGHPPAAAHAADALSQGFSAYIRQDYPTSRRIWEPLAAAGDPVAAYYLGAMYHFGLGVPSDPENAASLYRKAADRGLANAHYNLGLLQCPHGQCSPEQAPAAVAWFRQAAELGYGDAQHTLGTMYSRGLGVSQDDEEAYFWFSLAAAKKIPEALKEQQALEARLGPDRLAPVRDRLINWRPRRP